MAESGEVVDGFTEGPVQMQPLTRSAPAPYVHAEGYTAADYAAEEAKKHMAVAAPDLLRRNAKGWAEGAAEELERRNAVSQPRLDAAYGKARNSSTSRYIDDERLVADSKAYRAGQAVGSSARALGRFAASPLRATGRFFDGARA
jgi:hypothetical protein